MFIMISGYPLATTYQLFIAAGNDTLVMQAMNRRLATLRQVCDSPSSRSFRASLPPWCGKFSNSS